MASVFTERNPRVEGEPGGVDNHLRTPDGGHESTRDSKATPGSHDGEPPAEPGSPPLPTPHHCCH